MIPWVLLFLPLAGCWFLEDGVIHTTCEDLGTCEEKDTVDTGDSSEPTDSGAPPIDEDGDGHIAENDCDDADPFVHPDALEISWDGVDNDCNGVDGFRPSIAAGHRHTCWIRTDGNIRCSGQDKDGETAPTNGNWAQVDAAEELTCAMGLGGSLSCWGGGETPLHEPPTASFLRFDMGHSSACGWDGASTISCWGTDTAGEGIATSYDEALRGFSMSKFVRCDLEDDGKTTCLGGVGQPNTVLIEPSVVLAQVAPGWMHACGLDGSGTATCWGGDFTGGGVLEPPTTRFALLASGSMYTCGLTPAGAVECWGDFYDTNNQSTGPAKAPKGTGFVHLDAGPTHLCAIDGNNNISCTGESTYFQ